jgi:non-specific serine/threonine protein kinase/serine/threonine-protein kinase
VAATLVLAVSLLAGIAGTTRGMVQARKAETRAREAEARSNQRFEQVRGLARSFVFEIQPKVNHLSGSTPARELMVQRAKHYLDNLVADGADDPELLREVAAAYQAVGDMQGNPYGANLGDTEGALGSYRKALAIRERLAGGRPGLELAQSRRAIADVLQAQGKADEALAGYRRALEIVGGLPEEEREKKDALAERMTCHSRIGRAYLGLGQAAHALKECREALPIARSLADAETDGITFRLSLATLHGTIGFCEQIQDGPEKALTSHKKGLKIAEGLATSNPHNVEAQRLFVSALSAVAMLALGQGRDDEALAGFRRGLAILEPLQRADPRNVQLLRDLASVHSVLGMTLESLGRLSEALASQEEVLRLAGELGRLDPRNVAAYREQVVLGRLYVGGLQAALGRHPEALEALRPVRPVKAGGRTGR